MIEEIFFMTLIRLKLVAIKRSLKVHFETLSVVISYENYRKVYGEINELIEEICISFIIAPFLLHQRRRVIISENV